MQNQSDTTSPGSDLSGRTLGGYRLLRKLGSGGMADVYLAEQFSLNRRVAVKVLRPATLMHPEAVDRFAQEARAAAALIHGNIVQIHEVGCVEGIHFLAEEFVEGNWSIKSVIRKIVMSKTYQQAVADVSEETGEKSHVQKQCRRPAPAEIIRDSILALAGKLDSEPRDSVVSELGMHAINTNGKRHVSLGQTGKLRQRSVYLPVVRGAVPPSLAVFDFPNPDLVTGKRAMTTVPAQALFMMNSPFVHEMSHALSLLLLQNNVTIEKSIQQLYKRVLIRQAGHNEVQNGKAYVAELMEGGQALEQAFASFVQIVFCSAEFRFIE